WKVRYRKTTLGVVWSLAQPLLPALILGAVFSHALTAARGSSVPYALFLVTGMVPGSLLSSAVTSASGALVSNHYISPPRTIACPPVGVRLPGGRGRMRDSVRLGDGRRVSSAAELVVAGGAA